MQTFASKFLRSALVATALLSSSCGLIGGSGNCDPTCNGDKTGCPQLSSSETALGALHQGNGHASTILEDANPKWMGAIKGIKITRQGLPSPDPEIIPNAFGKDVKLYTSGWVFKYCSGMNSVVFGAGPETSTAQSECGNLDCSGVAVTAEPAIDSATAIATAFPNDPADTLYGLDFIPVLTNNQRIWTISKLPNGPAVKVNADTGAIIP